MQNKNMSLDEEAVKVVVHGLDSTKEKKGFNWEQKGIKRLSTVFQKGFVFLFFLNETISMQLEV